MKKKKTINFEELNDYIKWLIKDSILSARKNRDCTQEALAEEINVSAKTMQAYELDGKTGRIPKTTQFLYMAAVIDINLNELRDEIKGKNKRTVNPLSVDGEKFYCLILLIYQSKQFFETLNV